VSAIGKVFGLRVRELRERKGWTQEELAARCHRHWTYIGGIERGERNPTLRVISDLARALGVPIRDLFLERSV
jgi:transcriptional regulator with XRE-family HTH domain